VRGPTGWTALHMAARSNRCEVVRVLAAAGHPLDDRDFDGFTAMHFACTAGHEEAVQASHYCWGKGGLVMRRRRLTQRIDLHHRPPPPPPPLFWYVAGAAGPRC
jgi:hypothetical protein